MAARKDGQEGSGARNRPAVFLCRKSGANRRKMAPCFARVARNGSGRASERRKSKSPQKRKYGLLRAYFSQRRKLQRRNNPWRRLHRVKIPCVSKQKGGYLKGKSATIIFQKWGNMKFAYRNREFWCKGYYVDTVGKNTTAIKEYIANQLKVDKETDQLSIFDQNDPLTGSK